MKKGETVIAEFDEIDGWIEISNQNGESGMVPFDYLENL